MSTDTILADRNPDAADVAAELLLLLGVLREARELEWESSPRPRLWESEAGRDGAHEIPDPTCDAVADGRRLAVRVAVWEAWRHAHDSRRRLERALAAWEGTARLG